MNGAVNWNAATALTLRAHNNIYINANITSRDPAGRVQLETGQGVGGAGDETRYVLAPGVTVNLVAGLNFAVKTGTGPLITYQVITSPGAPGSVTATDLQGINGGLAGAYALGADIDASVTAGWNTNAGFDPLGVVAERFTGRFAGLGHTISGLRINRPLTDNVGLFGWIGSGGLVRDVRISGAQVSGQDQAGLLAGVADLGASISNVTTAGTVSGSRVVGGLVGESTATIADSTSSASVSAVLDRAGGLVGSAWGTITRSSATGPVTGGTYASGGLVGSLAEDSTITGSYAFGSVSGVDAVGGLTGFNRGTIERSFASGNVTAAGGSAGGLVGANADIGVVANTYATGTVSGASPAGGLVGYNVGTVSFSYSTGAVSGPGFSGGLVGGSNTPETTTHSFWDVESSGMSTSAGGTGVSTAAMRQWNTFLAPGWDIANQGRSTSVWRIYEGAAAPLLRNFFRDAVTVTPNGGSRVYDGTMSMPGTFNVQAGADPAFVRGTLVYTAADRNVGAHTVTLTGARSGQLEYDLDVETGTGTITPRPLTVTGINARDKVFDGTTNATIDVGGATLSGLIAGDRVGAITSTARGSFADAAVGANKPVTITGVSVAGDDLPNYVFDGVAAVTASILASQTGPFGSGGIGAAGESATFDARAVAAITAVQTSCGAGGAFTQRINCSSQPGPFIASREDPSGERPMGGWPVRAPLMVMDGGIRMP